MYIGAVIGAGFASGQEIMQFFIVNGGDWWKEIILVTFLFIYLGAMTLYLAVHLKANNYMGLISRLVGVKVGKLIDWLSMLMLLGGLSIMLSGSGAVFDEHLHAPTWLGILLIVLVNCAIIIGGLQGVLFINVLLVPVKICALIGVCLLVIGNHEAFSLIGQTTPACAMTPRHWFWAGILYVSYNMILVVAVLSTLGRSVTKTKAVSGGVLGGIGLGLTAGTVCLAGIALYPEILGYKVPTLYMAGIVGNSLKYPVGVLIWLAILTTAVANAHGLASRLATPGSRKYKISGVAVTILSVPLALLDFDRLVRIVYPFFGYAGLLLMIILALAPLIIRLRVDK